MHLRLTAFLVLSACIVNSALAGEVSELVKKMTSASEKLNYQGVFVMRKSDSLTAMRVQHGADSRGVWESMEALNGETRKVIRLNEDVTSIFPERHLLTVSRNKHKTELHPALPGNLDKLEKYYRFSRLSDDRIANHKAAVIDVKPNDNYRYGYRYWLDIDTGVLLKCDLLNENGDVVEQMMFTVLEYLPKAPESAFTDINKKGFNVRELDSERNTVNGASWQVKELPEGFMLTQSSERKTEKSEHLHLVYSDGLASVSVFIEKGAETHHRLDGVSSMGALNAYGARYGDAYVTVMGEVPATTVMQIAQSTEPVDLLTGNKNSND